MREEYIAMEHGQVSMQEQLPCSQEATALAASRLLLQRTEYVAPKTDCERECADMISVGPSYSQYATSSLALYSREIKYRKQLLTPETEHELAIASAAGDLDARNTLIRATLRLVVKMTAYYQGRGLPMCDLIQEGNEGLFPALNKFDPDRLNKEGNPIRFGTYATYWIRQSVSRSVDEQKPHMQFPAYVYPAVRKLLRVRDEFYTEFRHDPNIDELAARSGYPKNDVEALSHVMHRKFVSLEQSNEDEEPLGEAIPDEQAVPFDEAYDQKLLQEQTDEALQELSDRERTVLKELFGINEKHIPISGEAVGRKLGIHRERVRQIKVRAIKKLHRLRNSSLMLSLREIVGLSLPHPKA